MTKHSAFQPLARIWLSMALLTLLLTVACNSAAPATVVVLKVTVPNVSGMTVEQARQVLTSLNFKTISVVDGQNAAVPVDTVYTQQPAAGTVTDLSAPITLVRNVAAAPANKIPMPDVRGMALDQAVQVLKSLGFDNYTWNDGSSPDYGPGLIYRQEPAIGAQVDPKNTIPILYRNTGSGATITPTATRGITVTPPPQTGKLQFEDQFNGSALDSNLWTFATNGGGKYSINNGILTIESGKTNGGGAWIHSKQLYSAAKGKMTLEMRVRVSNFDMSDWGFYLNRVAVFSFYARDGAFYAQVENVKPYSYKISNYNPTAWHDYRIEYTTSEEKFYIDGNLVYTATQYLTDQPMYVRLDHGSVGTNQMIYIDYVRLYQ